MSDILAQLRHHYGCIWHSVGGNNNEFSGYRVSQVPAEPAPRLSRSQPGSRTPGGQRPGAGGCGPRPAPRASGQHVPAEGPRAAGGRGGGRGPRRASTRLPRTPGEGHSPAPGALTPAPGPAASPTRRVAGPAGDKTERCPERRCDHQQQTRMSHRCRGVGLSMNSAGPSAGVWALPPADPQVGPRGLYPCSPCSLGPVQEGRLGVAGLLRAAGGSLHTFRSLTGPRKAIPCVRLFSCCPGSSDHSELFPRWAETGRPNGLAAVTLSGVSLSALQQDQPRGRDAKLV